MGKQYLISAFVELLFLIVATNVFATPPVLLFSDIDSGPSGGNGDTSGGRLANEHGAIVTVWGNNLGPTQGTSTIHVGGQKSPYVYSWGNAISPANIHVSHGIQKITFQVHKISDNTGISIVTSSGASNILPFKVRAGNIYFVDDSNATSGTGTYADPWKNPASYISQLATGEKGATCYFRAGTYANTEYGSKAGSNKSLFYLNSSHSGVEGFPNAFVGYPNEIASFEATDGNDKKDANYFISAFKDYERGVWPDNNYNVIHYLTISNLKFVVNTYVASVRNHWRFIGNQCESDPAGTVFNSGTGLLMYGHKVPETSGAFLKEAKMYGNVLTGDTSKNKLNHAFYLGLGDSPDIGWNYIYDHDIQSGPYFSVNSEDSIQLGHGRVINARVHHNVIDTTNKPSRAISIHQVPPGSTIYFYNNILKGPTYGSSPVVNIRSGGIYMYNNTFYNDLTNVFTSPMLAFNTFLDGTTLYYNDVIDVRNNIFYVYEPGTKAKHYINIEDNASVATPIIDNNLYFGIPVGTFSGKASSGTNSLMDVDPGFVNIATGDFHLQKISPIKDAGTSAVSSVVENDFDGFHLPQGSGYPIGAYDYAGVSTTSPNAPQGLTLRK